MPNIAATLSLNVPAITALCKGDPGSSLLNGTGAPSNSLGRNGDFYLDTSVYNIYGPKVSGVWNGPTLLSNSILASVWNSTNTTVYSNSANWNSVYTTFGANSGALTTLATNSANWNSVYTTFAANSSSLTTLATNSAGWSTASILASSVYTTVNSNSATWNAGGGGTGRPDVNNAVITLSGNWTSSYNTLTSLSGGWQSTYTNVYNNSASWNAAAGTTTSVIAPFSAQWQSVYNYTNGTSAYNTSVYSTVTGVSSQWQSAYNVTLSTAPNVTNIVNSLATDIAPASARWNNVSYAYMFGGSADIQLGKSAYSTTNAYSGTWNTVANSAAALLTFVSTISTITAASTYVQNNSANTQFNNLSAYALSASYLAVERGIYVAGLFTGPYTDGTVVDYQLGNGRVLVGPADNLSFYSNYTGSGNALTANATLFYTGGLSARGGLSGTDITINPAPTLPTVKTAQNKYLPINVGGVIYYLSLYQ